MNFFFLFQNILLKLFNQSFKTLMVVGAISHGFAGPRMGEDRRNIGFHIELPPIL